MLDIHLTIRRVPEKVNVSFDSRNLSKEQSVIEEVANGVFKAVSAAVSSRDKNEAERGKH